MGGEKERAMIDNLSQKSRDDGAEREARINLENTTKMAELVRLKMKETRAYCSELEYDKSSVEQMLRKREKELVMTLRRNKDEVSEWSRRTADLQDGNERLQNGITKRDVFE